MTLVARSAVDRSIGNDQRSIPFGDLRLNRSSQRGREGRGTGRGRGRTGGRNRDVAGRNAAMSVGNVGVAGVPGGRPRVVKCAIRLDVFARRSVRSHGHVYSFPQEVARKWNRQCWIHSTVPDHVRSLQVLARHTLVRHIVLPGLAQSKPSESG